MCDYGGLVLLNDRLKSDYFSRTSFSHFIYFRESFQGVKGAVIVEEMTPFLVGLNRRFRIAMTHRTLG